MLVFQPTTEPFEAYIRRAVALFLTIQAGFEDVPRVRLSYCEGVLEIVGTKKQHEAIKCLIAALLITYFEVMGVEFFPSGSFTQAIEGVVEYQA